VEVAGQLLDALADPHIAQPGLTQSDIEIVENDVVKCLRRTCTRFAFALEARQHQIGVQAHHLIAAQHCVGHAQHGVEMRAARLFDHPRMQRVGEVQAGPAFAQPFQHHTRSASG